MDNRLKENAYNMPSFLSVPLRRSNHDPQWRHYPCKQARKYRLHSRVYTTITPTDSTISTVTVTATSTATSATANFTAAATAIYSQFCYPYVYCSFSKYKHLLLLLGVQYNNRSNRLSDSCAPTVQPLSKLQLQPSSDS